MKKNKLTITLAIAAFASGAFAADDEINYSFGLKSWNHKLKTTGSTDTENTSASIVSATARKGDYFLATSFFLPTTYSKNAQYILRKDTDYAAGYSLNSNFSALLGTKKIGVRQYSSGWGSSTINMTYLGLNAFTPVGESSFIFGQVTRSIKLTDSSITAAGVKETFTGYEAGYGYALNKNTQLTVGYRNQKLSVNNSSYSSNTLPGVIFGVNITP
jgi:hypothetical protein